MDLLSKMLIDFTMNGALEIFIIGTTAYMIARYIMRAANYNFGIWFGRKGGKWLWIVIALMISGLYHCIKDMFS